MAYTAAVLDSQIDVSDIRDLLVQGDTAFPTINFTLPAGFTGLTWRVRGTFMQFNLATQSEELAVTGSTTISVAWPVGSNFTTYYGEMQIVLVGTDALGNIVTKATGYVNVQRDFSISTVEIVDENLFEQLMAELSSSAVMLDQATEQEIINGVPKLAADREISDDHHLADKKYVDDHTPPTPVHNDLGSLQGGSSTERYHMTAAQIAALHAHSNKTALDAVSGTNTGDQDVSGAISTHNTDAGAHAGQFTPINAQLATDAITHMLATEFSGAYEGVDLSVRFATEIAGYSDVWAWIKARTQAENFAGLHVHDYIIVTCTNAGAYVLKMEIAGINTYKGSGDTEIPAHIDWISKDCWPDAVQYNLVNLNNGIGCDKFTATAGQTSFQLTYRGSAYPSSITSMTVNGVANTNFTYNSATGIMTYTGSALSAGAIIKAFWTAVDVPFMASNLNAYMNSLKMGVPNEAALDPFLTEVDFSAGGIYYYLPSALKAVITPKRMYAATRYTAGSLLTSSNNYSGVTIGPLWVPEEMEVCGSPLFATATYDKWYARQYPCFVGGNRKKGTGNGGSRSAWWVFPAYSGISTHVCYVFNNGFVYYTGASGALRVPVGFRIAKT